MFFNKVAKDFSQLIFEVQVVLSDFYRVVVSFVRLVVQEVRKELIEPFKCWTSQVGAGKQDLVLVNRESFCVEPKE